MRIDPDHVLPQRWVIVGSGSSGKTVLARELGRRLRMPVTHLDALYYDSAWVARPAADFADAQRQLVAAEWWVVEGNYASTLAIRLARAELVVWLNLDPLVCLVGILRRRLRYRGGQHAGDGVYDRITLSFVRYVLTYRRRMGPRVDGLIREHARGARVVTLRSRRAVAGFLASLEADGLGPVASSP